MALTVDKLINEERFSGDNVIQFLLYLPFGVCLLVFRVFLALILWVASIILPNKSAVRQMLSTLACWTFGVYVKLKGTRDPRCSVMVANYVSCLDSLAASHVLGTISLRKWKVPPFFASTLGIRNAAQFVRKQHFAECPSKPVLLQPEGGPTNGRGLLKFTDWPFPVGNRVQPVAISVERMFTKVTVHRAAVWSRALFPWWDALWFMLSPVTVFTLRLLPPPRPAGGDDDLASLLRGAIADALQVEKTDFKYEELRIVRRRPRPSRSAESVAAAASSSGSLGSSGSSSSSSSTASRLAAQVKEVLPAVPMPDILRDLALTRSVDVTITNFLEGVTPYTPETSVRASPSTSSSPPRYVVPAPTGTFPKSAKERQLSFQERKAEMIAEARKRYIEKHGLNVALNNC